MTGHRRRSIITRATIFMLLGAIVNVAVAWECAIRVDPSTVTLDGRLRFWLEPGPHPARLTQPPENLNRFGWQARTATEIFEYSLGVTASRTIGARTTTFSETEQFRPGGVKCFDCGSGNAYVMSIVSAGFPAISLSGECWEDYRQPGRNANADPLNTALLRSFQFVGSTPHQSSVNLFGTNYPYTETLPLRPIWPGFAINTIFYAVILWLLFTARLVLPRYRRLRRIKRGLCPACAYSIGVSPVCTECGQPVRIESS